MHCREAADRPSGRYDDALLPSYAGYRFLAEVIDYTAWLYFRFPLSLLMVEEMLAARGIVVSHEMVRQEGLKFGREIAGTIRRRTPQRRACPQGGVSVKWHLDAVMITIAAGSTG